MTVIKVMRYFVIMTLLTFQVQASELTEAEIDQKLEELRNVPAFTCTHEQTPPASKEVESLFLYGRYLERQAPDSYRYNHYLGLWNNFDSEEGEFTEIARYYRIAVAKNYYPAYEALIDLLYKYTPDSGYYSNLKTSRRRLRDDEIAHLKDQLLQQKAASGYLARAGELAQQYRSSEAMVYYYMGALAGNAEAQYRLAKYFDDSEIISEVVMPNLPKKGWIFAKDLYLCAGSQGHQLAWDDAARIMLRHDVDESVIPLLQRGVSAGSTLCAEGLENVFYGVSRLKKGKTDKIIKIPDPERARRYKIFYQFLRAHQQVFWVAGIILPDADKYIPLPPAPLPEWDGILPEQKITLTKVAKPSDALIKKLSREENLDPANGKPLN